MTRLYTQSGNSRPHEVAMGYIYGSDQRAPLERTPPIKVDWFHWLMCAAMVVGTALVCAYSMGWL